MVIRDNNDFHVMTLFNMIYGLTLFIEQISCDIDRNLSMHLNGVVFNGFFFNQAQDRQS